MENKTNKLVVTRHAALVDYLIEEGVVGEDVEVRRHVTPGQVAGKHVIGVLPYYLASPAKTITQVPLNLPPEKVGKELTVQELREHAGEAQTYRVQRVHEPVLT